MTERTVPVHDLLLALAGRLDDDLLAWARELLAVGEQDQAVELATAALAAEGVALPASLRDGLVAAARAARTDLDVDRALRPAATEPGTPHRFDAAAAPGHDIAAALTALPGRRLAGCRLHLTWRRTPAGAAPGPLPRAVVLVEADPDRSAEVLAYLLATELERAGAAASVEVFTTGAALPAYHVAALREAREVVVAGRATSPEPADPTGPSDAAASPPLTGRRRRPEPAALDESGVPSTPDGPAAGGGLVAGSTAAGAGPSGAGAGPGSPMPHRDGAPQETAAMPDRAVPDRSGPELFMGERSGPDVSASGRAVPELFGADRSGPGRAVPDHPAFHRSGPDRSGPDRAGPGRSGLDLGPDTDPFYGPLRVPLLAPLLDPTADGQDVPAAPDAERAAPTGRDPIVAASSDQGSRDGATERAPAAPAPAEPEPAPAPGAPHTPAPPGAGASGPGDLPAEWEREWRTGEWAIPRTRRPAPPPAAPRSAGSGDAAADLLRAPAAGEAHLPRRAERAEGRRRDPGSRRVDGAVGEQPAAAADDVSLFESPTARVAPAVFPSQTTATGRHPAGQAPHEPTPNRPAPPRSPSPGSPSQQSPPQQSTPPGSTPPGSTPPGPGDTGRRGPEPGRPRDDLGGAALFSPREPGVPLFGTPPRPDSPPPRPDGRPAVPATDEPRTGRRRRPDEPAPGTAAPFPPAGRTPAERTPAGPPAGASEPGARTPDGSEGPADAEPSSLLSGTERDLLSQLQAELTRERRPRPYRRAGQNGSAQPVNGHGPDGDRPAG